jgi:hypothetical protein
MSKTYRECLACGKHALSIATRCPACGHELLTQPVRRKAPRAVGPWRLLPVVALAMLVAAGLLARTVTRPSATGTRETAVAPGVPTDEADPDSATDPAEERFARTWTKVHARRSVDGELVAVLLPGDTVQADSLVGSWWRIALDGQVIGYVHASTLRSNSHP